MTSISSLLDNLNNHFEVSYTEGSISIASKVLTGGPSIKAGQYLRIMDSALNDGVYKVASVLDGAITLSSSSPLQDESFSGFAVALAVPPDVVSALTEINEIEKAQGKGVQSESIPNYSVTFDKTSPYATLKPLLSQYRKPYRGRYYFINKATKEGS